MGGLLTATSSPLFPCDSYGAVLSLAPEAAFDGSSLTRLRLTLTRLTMQAQITSSKKLSPNLNVYLIIRLLHLTCTPGPSDVIEMVLPVIVEQMSYINVIPLFTCRETVGPTLMALTFGVEVSVPIMLLARKMNGLVLNELSPLGVRTTDTWLLG